MEKAIKEILRPLIPVHNASGWGFRAFDRDDKEIGVYETAGKGVIAPRLPQSVFWED